MSWNEACAGRNRMGEELEEIAGGTNKNIRGKMHKGRSDAEDGMQCRDGKREAICGETTGREGERKREGRGKGGVRWDGVGRKESVGLV